MHFKEQAISHVFEKELEVSIVVPPVNTDILGTFSGDIARVDSILNTALKKARMGMEIAQTSLGIANEGSFGPHPGCFFIPAGVEVMVFIDNIRDIIISEYYIDEETNFNHIVLNNDKIDEFFLKKVKFPSHGLILKTYTKGGKILMFKGIKDINELQNNIKQCLNYSSNGQVVVETDMRAHMNPTRMTSIANLAHQIVRRIATLCIVCKSPGFGKKEVEKGLACSWCALPTDQIRATILHCVACDFKKVIKNRKSGRLADPSQCQNCNP